MSAPVAGKRNPVHGVTGFLSDALPDAKEQELTTQLVDELKRNKNFESPDETKERKTVLEQLQRIATEFVKGVARKKGLSQALINETDGQIFTFGSYHLGVYGPGSDIDTLLVSPKHVSRSDFFEDFPSILRRMAPKDAITELKPVPDAYVPIMKIVYSGIDIDLIFACILQTTISPNIDLRDDNHLRGLDEVDLRCLNGKRVTDEILTLVPQKKTFRHALRAVKLWAQRRAVYANVMGFPGGVAWALMVARICQMYPNAVGSKLIIKFFHLISQWKWPQPVMLKNIDEGPFPARIWNPLQNRSDCNHLMPIITPAFPSMCATHNITPSTKKVIAKELIRARDISGKIFDGKLAWSALFEKHSFFTKDYKYYLSIVCASREMEPQQKWSGLVESKVRKLTSSIEQANASIELARPFTKGFERVHECRSEEQVSEVFHGSLDYQVKAAGTIATDVSKDPAHDALAEGNTEKLQSNGQSNGASNGDAKATEQKPVRVYTTTYYVGILLAEGNKSLDISFSTNDFIRQCKDWPQYTEAMNSVKVIYTRK